MKKLLLLAVLAVAVAGGTAAVLTIHPQKAEACQGQSC
jgi:hypothetical protein